MIKHFTASDGEEVEVESKDVASVEGFEHGDYESGFQEWTRIVMASGLIVIVKDPPDEVKKVLKVVD